MPSARRLMLNLIALYGAGLIVLVLLAWIVLAILGKADWPAN